MSSKKLSYNIAVLGLSNLADRAFLYVLFLFIARYLGPDVYGSFYTAFVFANLAYITSELGLHAVLVREVARDKAHASYYLSSTIGIRIFALILITFIIWLFLKTGHLPEQPLFIVYALIPYFVLSYLSQPFTGILRAHEQMGRIAFINIVERSFVTVAGITFLILGSTIWVIPILFSVGALIRLALAYQQVLLHIKDIKIVWDLNVWKKILKSSYMIGVFMAASLYAQRIDIILASMLSDDQVALGYYTASHTIIAVLTLPALVFSQAFYPRLSMLFTKDKKSFLKLSVKAAFFLLAGELIISIFAFIFAEPFIELIYGQQYINSAPIFRILLFAVPLIAFTSFVQWVGIAANKSKMVVGLLLITTTIIIVLSLLLVPVSGVDGAALSLVVASSVGAILSILLLFLLRAEVR